MAHSLLFLPDISGFTDFVSHTEITHSQHIIAELLEVMIDANELDLELAEIEGDALFFYKEGEIPSFEVLSQQIERMYLAFHNHLRLYEHQRICDCGACQSASLLQIKFFAHAGNIQFLEIKGFKKPHGKEVIVVHRLMKNSVPIQEYLLLSRDLIQQMDILNPTLFSDEFQEGIENYDAGEIHYQFSDLGPLRDRLNELPHYTGHSDSTDPIKVKGKVELAPKELMEIISNLKYRHLWNTSADKILYQEDHLNRMGTEHVCVINGREVVLETVSKPSAKNKLVYGEKTKDFPLMKQFTNYFVVEEENAGSLLTIEGHLNSKNILGTLFKPILKKKLKGNFEQIFTKLKAVAEGSPLPI